MGESVIIDWNIINWITVVLMAVLGFMIFATFSQMWQNRASAA